MSGPALAKSVDGGGQRAKKFIILAIGFLILLYLVLSSIFFTVDQTQRALVLQFGQPVGGVRETGLHAKIPFIQKVVYFDNRLMEYDVAAAEIYTNDKKNMVVDAFVRWRIENPLLFYQRFKSDNSYSIIEEAKRRLGSIIVGELRRELGLHVMQEIISQNRGSIMVTVTDSSNRKLSEDTQAGIVVVDVRIKRADLPPENQKAVYDRMRTEREQQATKYRSDGRRNGQYIMAEADRTVRETIAEAEMRGQIIRGEADSDAARIYAEAYGADAEFYSFKRSLESYQNNFKAGSVILMDPDSTEYLRYFGSASPPEGVTLGGWTLPPENGAAGGAAPPAESPPAESPPAENKGAGSAVPAESSD
ncbi:MAG: protease modulator HflC [Deltaproteobacteria bacterium]|jgi:membrane protease subunit HflC|nr:protease modulator HflC [Deltaproteobacteria bacterium]